MPRQNPNPPIATVEDLKQRFNTPLEKPLVTVYDVFEYAVQRGVRGVGLGRLIDRSANRAIALAEIWRRGKK